MFSFDGLKSNLVSFASSVGDQIKQNATQSAHILASANQAINTNLVADPDAGTKQVPAEDSHPDAIKNIKLNIALNLYRVLSQELSGIATDIESFKDFSSVSAITNYLKNSQGQLADVVQTNAVFMESGNTVDVLSSAELKVLKSLLYRAGTAIRFEAPAMVDNAHNRILLAHSMIQEADVMMHKAQALLQSVKEDYSIVTANLSIKAQNNIKISGARIDLNPVYPVLGSASTPQELPSKKKAHLELPQWDGMSPVPAYVSADEEVKS